MGVRRLLLTAALLAAPAVARPAEATLAVTATVHRSVKVRTTGPLALASVGAWRGGRDGPGVIRVATSGAAGRWAPAGAAPEVLVVLPDGAPAGLVFRAEPR